MTESLVRRFGADRAHPPREGTPWRSIDGLEPELVVHPRDEEELVDLVRCCADRHWSLLPSGRGHALERGPALERCRVVACLDRLDRITYLNPADLVLSAQAGLSLAAAREEAARVGLELALTPPGWQEASLGGALALGRSGLCRSAWGRARDQVLGLRAVLADGTLFHSGGRVVKNVAGYDLTRLLVGSRGAFAIITEATFKLLPRPVDRTTLATPGDLPLAELLEVAGPLRRRAIDPAALAIWGTPRACRAALILEGEEADLARRRTLVPADLAPVEADGEPDQDHPWRQRGTATLLRLFVPPSSLAELLRSLPGDTPLCVDLLTGRADLVGGEELQSTLAARVRPLGGFCLVEAGPAARRRREDTLYRNEGPVRQLTQYLRRAFDPADILSPGRCP